MEVLAVAVISKFIPLISLALAGCFFNPPIVITEEIKTPKEKAKVNQPVFEIHKGVSANKWRSDPFESFTKFETAEIPASEIVLNRRLASYPKSDSLQESNLPPLPNIQRRVTGVMINGKAIGAILETKLQNEIVHEYVNPGSKVVSGSNLIPYLIVESITKNNLILKSPDGRTIKIDLTGASPELSDYLNQKFN